MVFWELTRQLVERLPVMITPRWVATRTQPIAVDDVVTYLAGVLELPEASGRVYEAGGPEVFQFSTMLRRVAAIENRRLLLLPVPVPPLAILAVADPGHRHRHRYRPYPHRLHDQ